MTFYQKLIEAVNKAERRYPNDYILFDSKSLRIMGRAKSLTDVNFVRKSKNTKSGILTNGNNIQKYANQTNS